MFGDRAPARYDDQILGDDARSFERPRQTRSLRIVTDHADQAYGCAERGGVNRDVAGAARRVPERANLHDRNRRFATQPLAAAFEVDIEERIAENRDT